MGARDRPYEARPSADAVADHTREVVDPIVDGVRVFNPGSAITARLAMHETILITTVDGDDLAVEK